MPAVDTKSDLRKAPRYVCRFKVQLGWAPEVGYPRQVQAECTNLSRGGMQVSSLHPVEARSSVNYYLAGTPLKGTATVRSCRRNGSRFVLALEFSADLPPDHFGEIVRKLEIRSRRN